jgi:hypothetical protein
VWWGQGSQLLFVLVPGYDSLAPLALWRLTTFQVLHRGCVLPVFLAALGALPGPLVVGCNAGGGYSTKKDQQELVAVDSHGCLRRVVGVIQSAEF